MGEGAIFFLSTDTHTVDGLLETAEIGIFLHPAQQVKKKKKKELALLSEKRTDRRREAQTQRLTKTTATEILPL